MSWEAEYSRKLKSADEALRCVESNMRVYVHANAAFPQALLKALARRGPHVRDVEVMHLLGFGEPHYTAPELQESFRHNALFIGSNMRKLIKEGLADYVPIHLSEIEHLLRSGQAEIDVALIQVTPPDRFGYVSMGVSVETSLTAARCARKVIAQVNPNMPRTMGTSFLHVRDIDIFVEEATPLAELNVPESTPEQKEIAKHVSSLIEDGSCIQTGIGGIPDAILPYLMDRKDLGVHTETVSDGAIRLIEAGVITGRRKQINRDKVVLGFCMGTRKLYDYVDGNPTFEFLPNEYTNDPLIIGQNDNVVAINSAVEVDVTGQVCSDSIGFSPISGFGGQLDFIRGAAFSKNGKPVIALPSTAKNGTISRIVPILTTGAGVVTTRADVYYVVTEFGVAYLHGKNLRQRMEALINIAHPKFREELFRHGERLGLLKKRPDFVTVS